MNLEPKENNNSERNRMHHLAETNIEDIVAEIPTSEQTTKTDATAAIVQMYNYTAEKPIETRPSSCRYSATGCVSRTGNDYDELRKDEYVEYVVDDKYTEPVENRG